MSVPSGPIVKGMRIKGQHRLSTARTRKEVARKRRDIARERNRGREDVVVHFPPGKQDVLVGGGPGCTLTTGKYACSLSPPEGSSSVLSVQYDALFPMLAFATVVREVPADTMLDNLVSYLHT